MKHAAAPLLLILALLGMSLLVPPPATNAIPVFDAANLAAQVDHYVQRLVEIAQRANQLINQLLELASWEAALEKLTHLPYRNGNLDGIFRFFHEQHVLLRRWEQLEGQRQALAYTLDNVEREFDTTFPGWKTFFEITGGRDQIYLRTEAGDITIKEAAEYARYQAARLLQTHRQALATLRPHKDEVNQAAAHLSELKAAMTETVGPQQVQELQTAFLALLAEDTNTARTANHAAYNSAIADRAARANAQMQAAAVYQAQAEYFLEVLEAQFGRLVPELPEEGVSPLPIWYLGVP